MVVRILNGLRQSLPLQRLDAFEWPPLALLEFGEVGHGVAASDKVQPGSHDAAGQYVVDAQVSSPRCCAQYRTAHTLRGDAELS